MHSVFDTHHEDIIHDAQFDYYGRRLATCSADRCIRIFDLPPVDGAAGAPGGSAAAGQGGVQAAGAPRLVDTLRGHDGPVWGVAWAHPRFGSILASCGYDGRVLIWKESSSSSDASAAVVGGGGGSTSGEWRKIKEYTGHTASVNAIAWAPHQLGAMLACASSDGRVSVLHFKDDGKWSEVLFAAHKGGANAVSWDAAVHPGSLITAAAPASSSGGVGIPVTVNHQRRMVTAGCDNMIRVWVFDAATQSYREESVLAGHVDWVRDVAFAPSIGMPRSRIASCGQDKRVLIWSQDAPGAEWQSRELCKDGASSGEFPDVVWRVSWSLSGAVLAISCGDNRVGLWRETVKGEWECVEEMDERSGYATGGGMGAGAGQIAGV